MLVRYYVELAFSADQVEAAMRADPALWLPEMVRASNRRGLDMAVRVGLDIGPARVDHEVRLQLAEPKHIGQTWMLPISWTPMAASSMLPSLEGELEVSPLGDRTSQLAISASYRPPLGWAGALSDRALMRRVAEATVKDFLDRVAHRLGAGIGYLTPEKRSVSGSAAPVRSNLRT